MKEKKEKKVRTDFSRISRRTDSMGVRFDKVSFERIKKDHYLVTGQQVVDFLMKWYEDAVYPNPVLERAAARISEKEASEQSRPKDLASQIKTKGRNVPRETTVANLAADPALGGIEMANEWVKREKRIEELEKELKDIPSGLTPLAKKNYIFDRTKELKSLKGE